MTTKPETAGSIKTPDEVYRVVTWNCWRAAAGSVLWDYFIELDPDVALLQEVMSVPPAVLSRYSCEMERAIDETGKPHRFHTAILVKGQIGPALPLLAPSNRVEAVLRLFAGNLLARQITPDNGPSLKAISVYNPWRWVDRVRLKGVDVTSVKLTLNRDVWVADFLWASLAHMKLDSRAPWIIAGDFNLSETFDYMWRGGPRGNREYLDRMEAVGLYECLRMSKGVLTPTFQNPRDRAVVHQIDHMFVTVALSEMLLRCDVGPPEVVFERRLSDHLPIVADFRLNEAARAPSVGK
jgi:endonuclease/exonuclease/phosphatase family metal-dependent hydrolase